MTDLAVPVFPARVRGGVARWVETRKAAMLCFVAALAVYGIESIAWPLTGGRDSTTYLMYFADMWHRHPAYPMLMLFRTPVAPLFYGPLFRVGGATLAEVGMAFAYAGSILAFSAAARAFGRLPAVLTGVSLLLLPAYGALFHQVSSDPVFAFFLALWVLATVRAFQTPDVRRFALLGILVVALVLTRPSAQILLLTGFASLLPRGPWRERVGRTLAFGASAAVLLLGWASYNAARYGDFTVARGGWASTPFYRVFVMEKIAKPTNGPASAELATAVRRDLMTRPPYAQLHLSTHTFFTLATDHMWGDLVWLSDYQWGWDTHYSILRRVALEAIRRHPALYAHDVVAAVKAELFTPYRWAAPLVPAEGPSASVGAAPAASQPEDIGGYRWWLATNPHGAPPVHAREVRLVRELARLQGKLPERTGSGRLALVLNWISRLYPRAWIWLVVGFAASLIRRADRLSGPTVIVVASLALLIFTMLGNPPALEYGLPLEPAFVLFALAALLGGRCGATVTAARRNDASVLPEP
jgi:hypothetical protein